MRLLPKSKKLDGWMAITFQGGEVREIRAAHIRRTSSARPVVTMIAAEKLEDGTTAERLAEMVKSWDGLRYHCTTMMQVSDYRLLPVEAPNVPPAELKPAMTWLVKDMIDFHVDEAIIDVLSVPPEKGTPRARVMYAIVTRKKLVVDLQHTFEEANVSLEVIDIPELAQRNIAALVEAEGRCVAMLYFDNEGGLLTFTMGGELYLSRRLDVSLDQLQVYDSDRRRASQERVALEIQRSLDHFGRQFKYVVVDRLVVAPIGDEDWGFPAFLGEQVDIKVESLNLELLFDISNVPNLKSLNVQQRYFLPLGLGLRLEEKAL
ncbi:type IV pilus biogenesis protein PilM [Lacisediminimonas profundi]|uniref:type IV pilus biogenesis protein PilM n=1 Tax=Lacisediminimonas profundi TaxID=2603856 RepID=UPI00124BC1F9|nr:agglutinin biogenesis protein MshI [Lacisediminimonas profundi]